jgi:transposase
VLKHAPGAKKTAAIDGTFVAANTSRHRLLNKPRLLERIELLRQNLAGAATQTPYWLAFSEQGKRHQLRMYRRALKQLEPRLAKNAKLPRWQQKPENKVLVSPADSDAPLGRDKLKTFRPLYNIQTARDVNTDWIMGYDVLPTNTDVGTLEGTLERCRELSGRVPPQILTDGRYATEQDLAVCERLGVTMFATYGENTLPKSPKRKSKKSYYKKEAFTWDAEREAYRCPNGATLTLSCREHRYLSDGTRLPGLRFRCPPPSCLACKQSANCTPSPAKGRCVCRSEREDLIDALRQRMTLPDSQTLYRRRSASIERCIGDMKTHRGLTRFSRRGLTAAQTTVGLWVLLHNGLLWLRGEAQAEKAPEPNCPPPDF